MIEMSEIERRAYTAMHDAFCRVRLLSTTPLDENGQKYLFLVADAAHNIPDALTGGYHQPDLERDVLRLEELLAESAIKHLGVRAIKPRPSLFRRVRQAIFSA